MVSGHTEETALGSAHGRFLDSLPRKAIELRGAVALLSETPSAEGPREDMRRRLHALYASALVFRNEPLAQAVYEGIERLDAAREAGRPLDDEDLELLTGLIKRLPELRGGDDAEASPAAPAEIEFAPRTIPPPSIPAPTNGSVRTSHPPPLAWHAHAHPLLQRVLHVLLLPGEGEQIELVELLRCDSLRVSTVASVEEAIASVQEDAPDVVLANEQLASEGELVAALHRHGATDFIPLVVFEAAPGEGAVARGGVVDGIDARVPRPFGADTMIRVIGRVTGTLVEQSEPAQVGDVTLDELAERVARLVRRGLVDAAERGASERVGIGEGTEVLAATYGLVADLRAAVVRESHGRVQFETRVARGGGPALIGPGPDIALEDAVQQLYGRRVILVEDDTAIVLLLANLLRSQGATVHEFTDGLEAREAAQRERPDLVITGAGVPSLDGFGLCRELLRDPLLADVPVLLLPAKQQLLTRAKEPALSLQLEPDIAAQVVASAVRLLRPRSELETKLKEPGELRGSLDGLGVIALLRSVRRARPDARVRIRDAWNLFECELRDGRLAQVTRTASDGSFVRNERALPQLLGATAGRFSVCGAEGAMKLSFEGTLDEVLMRGARELAGELDAVSDERLGRVARIVFDEDAYALLAEQTPRAVRHVIERLYAGDAPSKLLKSGVAELAMLEPILLDMARRGALRGVIGSAGEDLVAEARAARVRELPIELASPLSMVPPPPNPVISVIPDEPTPTPTPSPIPGEGTGAREVTVPGLLGGREGLSEPELPASARPSALVSTPSRTSAPELVNAQAVLRREGTGRHAIVLPERISVLPERPSGAPVERPSAIAEPRASERPPASSERGSVLPERASVLPERTSAALLRGREANLADAGELAAAAAEARRSRSTLAAWTVALLALAAIGFFVAREPEGGAMPEALGGAAVTATPASTDKAPGLSPRDKSASLLSAEENGFAIYDGITDPSVSVSPGQALLVVEATPELSGSVVYVNDRELGPAPQKLPLPEGVHELALKRGDHVSYRFVTVHPGRTWVLRSP